MIDSIQTVYSDQLSSAPGSVAQVRECAAQLTRTAKSTGTTIILVGHVTKEGALAHRKFKRPPKPDDQTAASQDGPRRDVCGSEIVAAAPIRTVSPLPLGLVGP